MRSRSMIVPAGDAEDTDGLPALVPSRDRRTPSSVLTAALIFILAKRSPPRPGPAALRRLFTLSRVAQSVVTNRAAAVIGHSARHAGVSSGRLRQGVLRYARFLDGERRDHRRPWCDESLAFRDVCHCRKVPDIFVAVFYGLLMYWVIMRLSGNSDASLLFEVGFLGLAIATCD